MLLARCGILVVVALAAGMALADTPASSVYTQSVAPGGTYPGVDTQSEGWFDVGGYCKVVDVGDLSAIAPTARGVPVFVPGPPGQWDNYRANAPRGYDGQLVLTTCCRPQTGIATLCSTATNPQSVSRDYGKLNEADVISANCTASNGTSYTETMTLTCQGDNGPDGQADWIKTADAGVPTGPQCVGGPAYWENDDPTETCTGFLPTTPAGSSATAVQVATASNFWVGGTLTRACLDNGDGTASFARIGRRGDGGYPVGGICKADLCPSEFSWTVGSYTCWGYFTDPPRDPINPTATPGETVSAWTIWDEEPPGVSGTAQATCTTSGTWSILPGATCGTSQCVPAPGQQIGGNCLASCTDEVLDSCGNVIPGAVGSACTGGACPLPPPGCNPVANGTTGPYPFCVVTCNPGYTLSGNSCVASGGSSCTPAVCPPKDSYVGGCTCEPTTTVTGNHLCAADYSVESCATVFNYCSAIFAGGPSADGCSCLPNYSHASSQCQVPDGGYNGGSTCCTGDGNPACGGCTPASPPS